MAKKHCLMIVSIFVHYCLTAQSIQKGILLYYPDSASNKNYSKNHPILNYKVQYNSLKNATVEIDVDIAIRNRDLRIITISGYSMLYPGLESLHQTNSRHGLAKKYEAHLEKYGCKIIEGTSDVINPEEPRLQSAAYDYAKKYNILLFKKIATRPR